MCKTLTNSTLGPLSECRSCELGVVSCVVTCFLGLGPLSLLAWLHTHTKTGWKLADAETHSDSQCTKGLCSYRDIICDIFVSNSFFCHIFLLSGLSITVWVPTRNMSMFVCVCVCVCVCVWQMIIGFSGDYSDFSRCHNAVFNLFSLAWVSSWLQMCQVLFKALIAALISCGA